MLEQGQPRGQHFHGVPSGVCNGHSLQFYNARLHPVGNVLTPVLKHSYPLECPLSEVRSLCIHQAETSMGKLSRDACGALCKEVYASLAKYCGSAHTIGQRHEP